MREEDEDLRGVPTCAPAWAASPSSSSQGTWYNDAAYTS
jgi:hypothetical protein